jgi:hypothetical protein
VTVPADAGLSGAAAGGCSEADVEPGWFRSEPWLDVLLGCGGPTWGEVVLVDPCGQWSGEAGVVAAGAFELVGGVDERIG